VIAGSDTEASYKVPKHGKECGLPLELGGESPVQRNERGDADERTVEVVEFLPPVLEGHWRKRLCRLERVLNIVVRDVHVGGHDVALIF